MSAGLTGVFVLDNLFGRYFSFIKSLRFRLSNAVPTSSDQSTDWKFIHPSLPPILTKTASVKAFTRLTFSEMLLQHDHAAETGERCFFDRALPDIFSYLHESGLDVAEIWLDTHANCRYERTVFILPPWPEIYVNDAERPQTLAETESLHDAIRAVYESLGYELIEVPKLPVEARCEFMLGNLCG
jgi:hypothetical protein